MYFQMTIVISLIKTLAMISLNNLKVLTPDDPPNCTGEYLGGNATGFFDGYADL